MNNKRKQELKESAKGLAKCVTPDYAAQYFKDLIFKTIHTHLVNAYEKGRTDEIVEMHERIERISK